MARRRTVATGVGDESIIRQRGKNRVTCSGISGEIDETMAAIAPKITAAQLTSPTAMPDPYPLAAAGCVRIPRASTKT